MRERERQPNAGRFTGDGKKKNELKRMYRTYKILIVRRNMGKTEAAGRRFMDSYYIWKISVIIFLPFIMGSAAQK